MLKRDVSTSSCKLLQASCGAGRHEDDILKQVKPARFTALAFGLGFAVISGMAAAKTDEQAVRERIEASVRSASPDLQVQEVSPTPMPGVWEAVVNGDLLYFSTDGRYMLQGEMLDLQERRSLTEQRRERQRAMTLSQIDAKEMLVYPAAGSTKHSITVVTDIDCPYCRRFHAHMADLNARGVEVRYLLLPRAGVQSDSYRKAVNVWCADQPQAAMTAAKQGKPVPTKSCQHQVDRHMALSQQLGVTGTPAILTKQGGLIAGYLPPEQLLLQLEQMRRQAR